MVKRVIDKKCPWCGTRAWRGRPRRPVPRRLRFIVTLREKEFAEMIRGKEYLVQQEPIEPVRYDYYMRISPHKRNAEQLKRKHEYQDTVYLRAISTQYDFRGLQGIATLGK